jgi:hypothetical protein
LWRGCWCSCWRRLLKLLFSHFRGVGRDFEKILIGLLVGTGVAF